MSMREEVLASSNLSAARYDDETQELEIDFASGSTYSYSGVPESEFDNLVNAGSPGGYFHRNIKNGYAFRQVG